MLSKKIQFIAVLIFIFIALNALSWASGSTWETNIKRSTEDTTIGEISNIVSLGTVDEVTNITSLDTVDTVTTLTSLDNFVYPSGLPVVNLEYPDETKFGLPCIDIHEHRVQMGVAFRVEKTLALTSGQTEVYAHLTQDDDYETWLQVQIDASDTFHYEVLLEPADLSGTTELPRSKNPHFQVLGGRGPETIFYTSPTWSNDPPVIRSRYYGTWGIPYLSKWIILSPNQRLVFRFTNLASSGTNYINITFHYEEVQDGVEE